MDPTRHIRIPKRVEQLVWPFLLNHGRDAVAFCIGRPAGDHQFESTLPAGARLAPVCRRKCEAFLYTVRLSVGKNGE